MSVSRSVTFWSGCGEDCVITITEPPMDSISMRSPLCSCRMPRGSSALMTRVRANPAVRTRRNHLGRTSAKKATNQTIAIVQKTVEGKKTHFITAMCRSMSWMT